MNSYCRKLMNASSSSEFMKLFLFSCLFHCSSCATLGTGTDKQALLAFKTQITHDPSRALSSWNESLDVCQWQGVTCSTQHKRVTEIDLHHYNLTGKISPFVGNLSFLKSINLINNSFHGEIPDEIGHLFRLQMILFSQNKLHGKIPVNLSRCSELVTLDLVQNNLEGTIPDELGSLVKLKALGLAVNNLSGSIPPSISNLSSLEQLSLSENRLSGEIPVALGKLSKLWMFQISDNKLTGSIPIEVFNMTSMEYFGVAMNHLVGEIPPYVGLTFPNVEVFMMGGNRFTGQIPNSISNLSNVGVLDFANNKFTGSIPANLGGLKNLYQLNFARNQFGTANGEDDLQFLNSLVNCSELEVISISSNKLRGELPNSIANLTSSSLTYLYVGGNRIYGKIPAGVENLQNLMLIAMEENLLTGNIPFSIGKLSNLRELFMSGNRLSGEIPASLENITFLTELRVDENNLTGRIPTSLAKCQHLQILDLSRNNLSGMIPSKVIGISSLSRWLDLSGNHLTGPIPVEVGNLKSLQQLYLSDNHLSSKVPSSLSNCVGLERLDLSSNSFHGSIPSSLAALKGLEELSLSRNNFSGEIPIFLASLPYLQTLNLSFNHLEGEVPKEGIFKNTSAFTIIGNDRLCGGISELHLQSCRAKKFEKASSSHRTLKIVLITLSSACLLSICIIVLACQRKSSARKKTAAGLKSLHDQEEEKHLRISYAELLRATGEFSSANLIGIGGHGSVYKGRLGEEETFFAVKVLDLQQRGASKSFKAECEALRSIRHRNLVKIITSCSGLDFKGIEFKALLFEFMPNGSIENWLYPQERGQNQRQSLSLVQRLSIAVDVANALDYLHHYCHTAVVHCDLKPSNILLDSDMVARVSDFGLARLLYNKKCHQSQTNSSRLTGSIGYVPPEYGISSDVTTYGDIYSYGILMLEMFTQKRPTDDMFKDGLSLHTYVEMAISFPDEVIKIADPLIVREHSSSITLLQEILASIFTVGVQCSAEFPRERMKIKDVIMKLTELKDLVNRICNVERTRHDRSSSFHVTVQG